MVRKQFKYVNANVDVEFLSLLPWQQRYHQHLCLRTQLFAMVEFNSNEALSLLFAHEAGTDLQLGFDRCRRAKIVAHEGRTRNRPIAQICEPAGHLIESEQDGTAMSHSIAVKEIASEANVSVQACLI